MIKQLVEKSGKTRSQIVSEVGFSQGYLSLLENGERLVGRRYLVPLSRALGVDPSELRPDLARIFTPSSAPNREAS